MSTSVGVIGLGHWGTALAEYVSRQGHAVIGWAREKEIVEGINTTHKHPYCFTNYPLLFSATDSLEKVADANVVIIALPTRAIAEYDFSSLFRKDQVVVSVMKGFEPKTQLTPAAYLKKQGVVAKLGVLSGPSFAIDVMTGTPVAVSAASESMEVSQQMTSLFMSRLMRVYPSTDLIGVELGGALKNIIAVASGICLGLGLGDSTKAALVTRGLAEMSRFAVHFGGKPQTLSGLSGLGDLILTTSSLNSRNYSFGFKIGEGLTPVRAVEEVGSTAEGYFSTPVVEQIARTQGISMPITVALNRVLAESILPEEMVGALMSRPAGEE